MAVIAFQGGAAMAGRFSGRDRAVVTGRAAIKRLAVIDRRHRSEARRRHIMTGIAGIAGVGMATAFAQRNRPIMTFHAQALADRHVAVIHADRVGETQHRQWLAMASAAHVASGRMGGRLGAPPGARQVTIDAALAGDFRVIQRTLQIQESRRRDAVTHITVVRRRRMRCRLAMTIRATGRQQYRVIHHDHA